MTGDDPELTDCGFTEISEKAKGINAVISEFTLEYFRFLKNHFEFVQNNISN